MIKLSFVILLVILGVYARGQDAGKTTDRKFNIPEETMRKLNIDAAKKGMIDSIMNYYSGRFNEVSAGRTISPSERILKYRELRAERDAKLKEILTEAEFKTFTEEMNRIAGSGNKQMPAGK